MRSAQTVGGGSFEDETSGYFMLHPVGTEDSEDSWLDDRWTDSESGGSSAGASMQIDGPQEDRDRTNSHLGWNAIRSLCRRLFYRRELTPQPSILGQMLFGRGDDLSASSGSAMRPLLEERVNHGDGSYMEGGREGGQLFWERQSRRIPREEGMGDEADREEELGHESENGKANENCFFCLPRSLQINCPCPSQLFSWMQKCCLRWRDEPRRIRENSSTDSSNASSDSSWKHKVMEVLPVLAIVALAAIGAVFYLILADGVWPVERAEFFLNCDVGRGQWIRSSERNLYSSSCPYMRDAWNCHKFGLTSSLENWRWEPDQCILPLFDPHEFLRIMRGKRIGFVGDESGANAFDSLVCMLAEAETPHLISGAMESRSFQGDEQLPPSSVNTSSGDSSYNWGSFSGWHFGWHSRSPKTGILDSLVQKNDDEGVWSSNKMAYFFAGHNFTLLLYDSPLLVKTTRDVSVNKTACESSKSVSTTAGVEKGRSSERALTSGRNRTGVQVEDSLLRDCYPNRIEIDQPDPLWASEAAQLDVIVLNSGKEWREEAAEMQGLGIYSEGLRRIELSMEGLVGEWAYPRAIAGVTQWLRDPKNFQGTAIFRSYSPGHQRKECAGRMMLPTEEMAIRAVKEHDYERYDEAVVEAIGSSGGIVLLNVTMLSAERGDGHPWMASPFRPKTDCVSWCLPGIPDVWNEILGATLLEIYGKDHPSKPLMRREGLWQE